MSKKHIITVIGNVGVGKTTALPLIAKALNADSIHADELFQTENPFRKKFLADTSRWGFANELWLLHKRISLIQAAVQKSSKQIIVIDSGLMMSWVYMKSHYLSGKVTIEEWLFFEELFMQWSTFAFNTTIIYFTAPNKLLLERIKKRNRSYEVDLYKKEYLEQLEVGLRDLCSTFSPFVKKIIPISVENIGNIIISKNAKRKFMQDIKNKLLNSIDQT